MNPSFSLYLKKKIEKQGLTISKTAELTGISRQHLHKIINGDIAQARMTTFIGLAHAIGEHPLQLFRAFLNASNIPFHDVTSRTPSFYESDDIGFIGETCPDNSIVKANKSFEKKWKIQNLGSVTWVGRKIICLDDNIKTKFSYRSDHKTGLIPDFRELDLAIVRPGERITITVPFTSPTYPCTVISHWKMVDKDGNLCFPENHPLSCCVKVISF